ncbi:MAG TPA: squalene/phytoene synthase family protein [Thermomicrobiaceae bacterium]|nr:squalene/phytoene synthase family protein [Thermomicrobiaceae bacterium]
MSELTELQSADAYCRLLARRHYENFTVLSAFVPSAVRLHLARIYAYCRTTDDFGDESGDAALARLTSWRTQVEQCFARTAAPIHPVLIALRPTIESCGMTVQPFLDLVAANEQDQTVTRYETWDELKAYCDHSAAPVGRMVLRAFGVDDQRATALSDDVCIGLQLANFAQDVARDGARGRAYVLQSDLRTGGLPGAVRSLCDRAEVLLASGCDLESRVPRNLGRQIALYRLGGSAVVDAVRRVGYRTDLVRPRVSSLVKARLAGGVLLGSGRGGGGAHAQSAAGSASLH